MRSAHEKIATICAGHQGLDESRQRTPLPIALIMRPSVEHTTPMLSETRLRGGSDWVGKRSRTHVDGLDGRARRVCASWALFDEAAQGSARVSERAGALSVDGLVKRSK